MMKKIYYLGLVILIINIFFCVNFNKYGSSYAQNMDEDFYTINFPVGTLFRGILLSNISSLNNNTGDNFELILPSDIKVGDITCIPKDSRIVGKIIRLSRAQQGQNGYFEVVMDTLKLSDDKEINFLGHIWTRDGRGIIGGEFTERINYKKVPHMIEGIGGVVQLIPDGPRKMGKETQALTGSEWIVVLDKELKLKIIKE